MYVCQLRVVGLVLLSQGFDVLARLAATLLQLNFGWFVIVNAIVCAMVSSSLVPLPSDRLSQKPAAQGFPSGPTAAQKQPVIEPPSG